MEDRLYRIVKEYPYSPPVGTILHYNSFADWYQDSNEDYVISPSYVEKYPDFFEELNQYRFLVFTVDRPHHKAFEVIELRKPIDMDSYNEEKFCFRLFRTKKEAYDFILLYLTKEYYESKK